MEAAARQLRAASASVTTIPYELNGAMDRAHAVGPFSRHMNDQLRNIASTIHLGGTALRGIAERLERDAQQERLARKAEHKGHS